MATSLMFTKLVVTHGISVHRSAVLRTSLQQMKSWSGRKIMCIIVKIMRIIVLEDCIRLLSLLYECLVVNPVELASSLTLISHSLVNGTRIAVCTIPLSRCRHPVIIENNRKNNEK